MKTHRTTKEEMEGPISFWGYKEQESNLILPEHDDDDMKNCVHLWQYLSEFFQNEKCFRQICREKSKHILHAVYKIL